MDKWQRWRQMEGDRSPITGFEIVMGPVTWDIPLTFELDHVHDRVSRYDAQLVVCDCDAILDVGESCEHLAVEAGLPPMIRVLVSGYRTISWRSFSPTKVT